MNVVFMGSPEFAVSSLSAILHSSHKVLLAMSQPDKPAGRGQKMKKCAVAEFSAEHKIPLAQPETLKNNSEILQQLKSLKPDAIVVVAYGKILPKEVLAIPKLGCVNVHASLLPKYRGAAPINWAIIKGERRTGVSTMLLNEKMDEGDVLLQCATEITPDETAETLYRHLAAIGADLIVKTLDQIQAGGLKGIPQDSKGATYAPKLKKEEAQINWEESAASIYNKIRGLQPWPCARVGELKIFDAAVLEKDTKNEPGTVVSLDRGIAVQTGFGQLCILEVQDAGRKRMPAAEYLRGTKLKVGGKL